MSDLQDLAAQTAPYVSPADVGALIAMREWSERERRGGFVPEVRFRLGARGHEVELWLHPEPGHHDERIPPHGRGEAPTLLLAWVRANESLMEDLYRFAEVGS